MTPTIRNGTACCQGRVSSWLDWDRRTSVIQSCTEAQRIAAILLQLIQLGYQASRAHWVPWIRKAHYSLENVYSQPKLGRRLFPIPKLWVDAVPPAPYLNNPVKNLNIKQLTDSIYKISSYQSWSDVDDVLNLVLSAVVANEIRESHYFVDFLWTHFHPLVSIVNFFLNSARFEWKIPTLTHKVLQLNRHLRLQEN